MELSKDIINTLPQGLIETILCFLPIEEAARTSILAKEWRYKWTKIPKLEFHEYMVKRMDDKMELSDDEEMSKIESGRENMYKTCKFFYIIHQVMLLRQAPIHEFTLSMHADDTCCEIDQIILHLSRNHSVTKFRLSLNDDMSSYILPFSIYSFHHLTELSLEDCEFNSKLVPKGFPCLTSLTMSGVMIARETLLHLLYNCPSLKHLCFIRLGYMCIGSIDDNFLSYGRPNIMLLFKCLPVIEHLTTWAEISEFLLPYSIPKELSASMMHLKYCSIEQVGFAKVNELRFLCLLIKCSPNLEKIKLRMHCESVLEVDTVKLQKYSDILEEYSDVWLECLNEVEIEDYRNNMPVLEFVKFIMARTPNLKKVILSTFIKDKNKELELSRILTHAPCVAPIVNIIIETFAFVS